MTPRAELIPSADILSLPDVGTRYIIKILGGSRYIILGEKRHRYEYEIIMDPLSAQRLMTLRNEHGFRCIEMTPPREPTMEE